jgi:DNA end-binding protein Ku
MPTRAMWKADLVLDELRVPVKLYAAVRDTRVHFRLLHAKDHVPVKQQMVDSDTQEPVPPEETRRAVQVERGVYVALTPQELAAIAPKPSRDITVERVVTADKLDERWFDRPYYLGPDGADDAYFALAAALEAKSWIGIAHWVLRNKSYSGALYGSDGYLLLDTLRGTQEVVEIEGVRTPPGRAPDPREIKLAEQLIDTLEDEFDLTKYKDEYREQVLALLEAKAKGKVVRFPKAARRKPSDSLLKDLQASLKGGRRSSSGRR